MVDGVGVGAEKAGPATATINLVAAPAQVARSGSPRFIPSAREPKLPGGEAAKAEKRPVGPAAPKSPTQHLRSQHFQAPGSPSVSRVVTAQGTAVPAPGSPSAAAAAAAAAWAATGG